MNYAFRSHLMQQFAASARNQSRPPLVLASPSNSNRSAASNVSRSRSTRSTRSRSVSYASSKTKRLSAQTSMRSTARSSACIEYSAQEWVNEVDDADTKSSIGNARGKSVKSHQHQENRTANTNGTIVELLPRITKLNIKDESIKLSPSYMQISIQRSIQTALSNTCIHETEPLCLFKQIVTQQTKSRLIEIYNNMQQTLLLRNTQKNHKSNITWENIPTFLVISMKDPCSNFTNNESSSHHTNTEEYNVIPKIPKTEHQLEQYSIICTITQQIMHSLRAYYGILSSKLNNSLYPIIHTPAFRRLIAAKDDDFIVALLLIGLSSDNVDGGRNSNVEVGNSLQYA